MLKRLGMLGLFFLAFATSHVFGQEQARPLVVIVGIDQYDDPQIKPRKHAEADAKALRDLFVSEDHLGVPEANVKLLLGNIDRTRASEVATKANILKALHWLEKSATKDSLVVFAFLGQGAPIGERSCYFAVDSTFKKRDKDAVASGDIEHAVEKIPSQKFVAFIDVNFLGFDPGNEKAPDPNLQNFYREFLGSDDNPKATTPNRVLFLANSGLKPALDDANHGLFAQVLLDGLKGKADAEGYEPDGNITVNELIKYVRKEIPERSRTLGKTDEEKTQQPVIFELHTGDFTLDYNPAVRPLTAKRLQAYTKLAQDKGLSKDLLEEGTNLLSRMPKLEAQQALRKAYQRLADGKLELASFDTERKTILDSAILSERDANNYAMVVMKAIGRVRDNYVKDVSKGTLVADAVRGLYRNIDEPLPSAIKDRVEEAKNYKEVELVKLLTDARQHLGKREDLVKGKDVTYSLHMMLSKLDKHTDYIDPEMVARISTDIRGHFFGIGVQIRKNNLRDQLQVVTPIINSPAYKAGLRAEDIITTIVREVDSDGKPFEKPEILPTKGMSTEEAVKKILGTEGTKVKLLVEREGNQEPLEFNLIRGKVEVESVLGHKRNEDDTWNYVVDPENKICYVRLTQFSHNTYRDLERVMRGLSKSAGIKGFILDLRFNPGGLLDSAVKISDLFIDDGMIVTIKPRNGAPTSYVGRSDGSYTAFPMVCLINGSSASASEIVSACLQDHGRAIVVGTRSYGKGSVQTIHPFETGGQLKLTTATFWRPSNRNLNRSSTQGRDEDEWGVLPDAGFDQKLTTKEINDLQDHLRDAEIIRGPTTGKEAKTKAVFQDRQLDMALQYLRSQIRNSTAQPIAPGKKAG